MKDLIERRNVLNLFDSVSQYMGNWLIQYIEDGISSITSAQPEIIHCKDCKHRPIKKDNGTIIPPGDDEKCPCLCDDEFYSWISRDDFFCANGERREE